MVVHQTRKKSPKSATDLTDEGVEEKDESVEGTNSSWSNVGRTNLRRKLTSQPLISKPGTPLGIRCQASVQEKRRGDRTAGFGRRGLEYGFMYSGSG